MKRNFSLAAAALSFFYLVPVHGQVPTALRIAGYGTIGYVLDDRSDIVAIRDVSQRPDDRFQSGQWRRDTRLGLQAEYRVNAKLDIVGQVSLRDQVSTAPEEAVELAFAAVNPTARLDLRFGRVGYDAFLMSDIRNVGYAYPWVRPFTEYYGWIPLFSIDGADAAYVIPQGDAQWHLKGQLGQGRAVVPIGAGRLNFKADGLVSLSVKREEGPWLLKLGYSRFTSATEAEPLLPLHAGLETIASATAALFPAISAEALDLRKHDAFKDARISYLTFGASYNDDRWLVQGELAHTTSNHKAVPHGTMAYGVIGCRFGDWMPFFAFSATRPDNSIRLATTDWSIIGQTATQTTAISIQNSTRMDQQTVSLGTRWDFHNQAALKLQWDSTQISAEGYGLVFKDPALQSSPSRLNQLTLTLDFIF